MKNDDNQINDIIDDRIENQNSDTSADQTTDTVTSDEELDANEEIVIDEESELDPMDRIKKLRSQLKTALSDKQAYMDGWQREKAEFINIRKRDEESKLDFVKFAESQLIEELVPVLDSCREALKVADSTPEASEWAKGIKSMYSKILAVCEKRGLKEYGEVGDVFDPTLHQSVSSTPTEDKELDETIATILQKGYKLKDRIIRPALVAVYQV